MAMSTTSMHAVYWPVYGGQGLYTRAITINNLFVAQIAMSYCCMVLLISEVKMHASMHDQLPLYISTTKSSFGTTSIGCIHRIGSAFVCIYNNYFTYFHSFSNFYISAGKGLIKKRTEEKA